ncbi:hypothetical protein E2C01_092334 [Portunus trituberculatus]|uniref:Secreted protein n=1 Tax=Portunus trituberculatus TaxID=210409 RepID=A0A5B7JRR6_PORTR|nr:hypothetical protein [Portunus trituberculatus]
MTVFMRPLLCALSCCGGCVDHGGSRNHFPSPVRGGGHRCRSKKCPEVSCSSAHAWVAYATARRTRSQDKIY